MMRARAVPISSCSSRSTARRGSSSGSMPPWGSCQPRGGGALRLTLGPLRRGVDAEVHGPAGNAGDARAGPAGARVDVEQAALSELVEDGAQPGRLLGETLAAQAFGGARRAHIALD